MIQIKKISILLLMALLALSVTSCTATNTRESAGQYLDNTAITTKVKAQLFNHLGAKSFDIKVKSFKDTVQLSGFVDSDMLKHRAANIARRIDGVGRVVNNIIVK